MHRLNHYLYSYIKYKREKIRCVKRHLEQSLNAFIQLDDDKDVGLS